MQLGSRDGAIDLYFDVVCPFAYLASTRIAAIAARSGRTARWRPILLGGLLRAHASPTDPNASMPAAKRRLVRADMTRQAALHGAPLRIPDAHPRRTVDAMRLLTAVPEPERPAAAARLFRAYWVDGDDVSDRATLRRIGATLGFADVDAVLDDQAVKDRLRAETDAAASRGVFGVPTVVVDDLLVWGADRLPFVERALGLDPAPLAACPTDEPPRATIELFHDVASPFSYLAWSQRTALAAAAGAAVVSTPILVGALFRAIGTPDVPLHTFSAAKAAYVAQDLERWAAWYGVPFRYASRFPIRSLLAGRVAIAEPAAIDAMYRAAWAEDRDVATADGLRAVLDGAGFDGGALLARADDPDVKEALRANTERAAAVGACGVPSLRVGDALFWGQDRLDQVVLAAKGWRAPSG